MRGGGVVTEGGREGGRAREGRRGAVLLIFVLERMFYLALRLMFEVVAPRVNEGQGRAPRAEVYALEGNPCGIGSELLGGVVLGIVPFQRFGVS